MTDSKTWAELAEKELRGTPLPDLTWQSPEGIPIKPLYTEADLEERIRRIAGEVSAQEVLQGFIWTQLTDIQQEINGLLYFDRSPKLPVKTLKDIFSSIGRGHRGPE